MRIRTMFVVAAMALPATLSAQPSPPVFARLAGAWKGTGTLLGRAGHFEMRWEDRGEFAILTFRSAFAGEDGPSPVLAAAALYRTRSGSGDAVWLDSRGVRIEIRWTATDSTLTALWSAPDETGRTTYRLVAADVVEVVDEVRGPDGWRTFAVASYRRDGPGAGRPASGNDETAALSDDRSPCVALSPVSRSPRSVLCRS